MIHCGLIQKGKGDCNRRSSIELGMRRWDWIWRSRRDEDLQSAYMLPCQQSKSALLITTVGVIMTRKGGASSTVKN